MTTQLDAVLELLVSLGVEVRREEGSGGGLCRVRGRTMMFDDLAADPATRLQRCIEALASIPEVDRVYVMPAIREAIERVRAQRRS